MLSTGPAARSMINGMRAVTVGFGLGFLVALQLGPMSLFLVRSTLRAGLRVGLAIGAGIALVDALYAALGAAGVASLLRIEPLRLALGVLGALVLAVLGIRTLWTAFMVRAGVELPADVAGPWRAFVTSAGATASNPLTIASWAAVFAAASVGGQLSTVPLVLGVGLGSALWVCLLALLTAVVRRAVGPTAMRIADGIAGLGMLAFAGILGYRTAQD
jgi:putative LysE/RhtB family amino acid efflux pump